MSGNLRTVADVEEELSFLERSLARLRRSFKLEKEDVLSEEEKSLWFFREHSRSYYQPAISAMHIDFKQLRYKISKMEQVPSSIFQRLEALEKAVNEARAYFTGTPNRLLRGAGQITGDD
ncbi:MAG: hypothetical protein KAH54_00485 [Candidatus Sabulitectum sp.]|nr:hypothetical protein [Candidatus Sabulitectum sp.]